MRAHEIVAVIGKTEGNGGVNDFTRGYFTQTLMALLGQHFGEPAEALMQRIPCVLSGGTEGVLSPHYVVLSTAGVARAAPAITAALAIGTSVSAPVAAEHLGRVAYIRRVAAAVRTAIDQARIDDANDVHFVQVKCPCITSAHAEAAKAVTPDPSGSMAFARAAGAFGVALALGEIEPAVLKEGACCRTSRPIPHAPACRRGSRSRRTRSSCSATADLVWGTELAGGPARPHHVS